MATLAEELNIFYWKWPVSRTKFLHLGGGGGEGKWCEHFSSENLRRYVLGAAKKLEVKVSTVFKIITELRKFVIYSSGHYQLHITAQVQHATNFFMNIFYESLI